MLGQGSGQDIITDMKKILYGITLIGTIVLTGMLVACGSVEVKIPQPTQTNILGTEVQLRKMTTIPLTGTWEATGTPTLRNSATAESTAVPRPTEVPPKIDPTPASFPVGTTVEERFNKGDYKNGIDNITDLVTNWAEMSDLALQNTASLNLVPLDGRAGVVCVDTKGQGDYAGKLLCPPLDLVNGGLRPVANSGQWDRNADGPLFVTLNDGEALITKGSGTELVYQIVDKYSHKAIRYIDAKTGQYVDGEAQVQEIKLPEIVPGEITPIPDIDFGGMKFKDPKAAFRELTGLLVDTNLGNEKFWAETLGTSAPTLDQLLAWAKGNVGGPENKPGWLPFETKNGTRFSFLSVQGNITDLRKSTPKFDGVYLDGMYAMVFDRAVYASTGVHDFVKGVLNLNKQNNMGIIENALGSPVDEFGLVVVDNRLVWVSGSEMKGIRHTDRLLGGEDSFFKPDDLAKVTAQYLSYLKAIRAAQPIGVVCTTSSPEEGYCSGGVYYGSLTLEQLLVEAGN
jgi:hypothetical protein